MKTLSNTFNEHFKIPEEDQHKGEWMEHVKATLEYVRQYLKPAYDWPSEIRNSGLRELERDLEKELAPETVSNPVQVPRSHSPKTEQFGSAGRVSPNAEGRRDKLNSEELGDKKDV